MIKFWGKKAESYSQYRKSKKKPLPWCRSGLYEYFKVGYALFYLEMWKIDNMRIEKRRLLPVEGKQEIRKHQGDCVHIRKGIVHHYF